VAALFLLGDITMTSKSGASVGGKSTGTISQLARLLDDGLVIIDPLTPLAEEIADCSDPEGSEEMQE